MIGRRGLLGLLAGPPLALRVAHAQRRPRIGCLTVAALDNPAASELLDAFRDGLRALGYVEGASIELDCRSAEGRVERLPALAADLVGREVDVIAAFSNAAVHAASRATTTIPIVSFGFSPEDGLVESLARPGRNITGFALLAPELAPKGLALLVEATPGAGRVAALWMPGSLSARAAEQMLSETAAAAERLEVQLQIVEAAGADGLEPAVAEAARLGADALLVLPSPLSNAARRRIAELAARHRLPSLGWNRSFAEAGCLLAYGSDIADGWRRGAVYVDRLLKGARPADLPIQQPTHLSLVVNLRTAAALGLTVPPAILLRAEEVIE